MTRSYYRAAACCIATGMICALLAYTGSWKAAVILGSLGWFAFAWWLWHVAETTRRFNDSLRRGLEDPDEDWHAELDSALKKMRSEP